MKCHYVKDKKAGKVLTPGCIGVDIHNDVFYCTCKKENKDDNKRKAT